MVSAMEEQTQEIRRPSVKPQQCQLVSLTLRSHTPRQTSDTFRVSCTILASVDTNQSEIFASSRPRILTTTPGNDRFNRLVVSISISTGFPSNNSTGSELDNEVVYTSFRFLTFSFIDAMILAVNLYQTSSLLRLRRTLTGDCSCCKDVTMAKGSQNTRTITKKNNPFSGGRPLGPTSGKQRQRSMELSRKRDVARLPNGTSLNVDTLSRSSPSSARTEHRTFYNDPMSVRQWAAETDPNTPANFAEYGFPETTFATDAPAMSAAPQLPGSFPVSCSSVSHVSFPVTNGFPSDDLNATCAEAGFQGLAQDFGITPNTESLACMDPVKNHEYEAWSYPTPTADDMAYSTATAPYVPYGDANNIEPRFSNWSWGALPLDDEFSRADYSCGSQSIAWSPLLATDPSVSSSYSQGSYLAMQATTPLSPVAQEPDWTTGHGLGKGEENGFYPAFSLGEAFSLPAGCQFGQNDDMRFVGTLPSPNHPLII